MSASLTARRNQLNQLVGQSGNAKVNPGYGNRAVYVIKCNDCYRPDGRKWTTHQRDASNSHDAALIRWVRHLAEKHTATPVGRSLAQAYQAAVRRAAS